jgi:hypothetical protein
VFNGVAAWQLYHGENYATPVDYRFNEWMHVKIVYADRVAKIYIDSDEPVLIVDELKRDELNGAIGLNAANFADAYFANFRYMALANAYEFPYVDDGETLDPKMIEEWQVSNPFDSASLAGTTQLAPDSMDNYEWLPLEVESSGIANLARLHGTTEGHNTVFARTTVTADQAEMRELQFGYSDSAIVFVNGERIYSGDNTYMSRDFRYLGTIGLFDSVVLPLKAGENEIRIAITESFGGWGVIGAIGDL